MSSNAARGVRVPEQTYEGNIRPQVLFFQITHQE